MRPNLRVIALIVASVALINVLIIAIPGSVAVPIFAAALWLCPSVWTAGAIYTTGIRRAFFIGGLAGGAVPFLAMAFASTSIVISAVSEMTDQSMWGTLNGLNDRDAAVTSSLLLLSPVLFSLVGGGLSAFVYRSAHRITQAADAGASATDSR